MADPQYYRLELDDVSTPAFTSFGKFYYGTMDEIKGFIDALDAADYTGDYSKDLVSAFDAYLQGHTNVTHSVAYHEVPLIKLVRLLHEENLNLADYSWEHLNTWGYPYYMRCSKVETRHLWLECDGTYSRVMFANFTNLDYQGVIDHWKAVGTMLWGYPELLNYEPPHIYNRIAEPEKVFATENECEEDWIAFKTLPVPDFTEFCNDIFGDG